MEKCKKVLWRLFFLPFWLTVLLSVPSFVLVIYVLAEGRAGAAAYLSYGLSAYALVITGTQVFRIVRYAQNRGLPLLQKIRSNPVGERYLTDPVFRTQVGLYLGFLMNVLYIFMKVFTGIATSSAWLIASGIYYLALTLIRYPLVRHVRYSGSEETASRRARMCGILLPGKQGDQAAAGGEGFLKAAGENSIWKRRIGSGIWCAVSF